MTRRWVRLGVPALAVVVAAASLALLAAKYAGQSTVTGWVASHQLAPGAVIGRDDVRQINVATGADSFSVANGTPVGARTAHTIASGDLIRADDVSSQLVAQVPITLKVAPPLSPGSSLDVYAMPPGSTTPGALTGSPSQGGATPVLVARGVSVVAAGPPVVIQVPAQAEPLWMSLVSSQTELLATLSTGASVPSGGTGYQPGQAIQILNQLAQGGGAPSGGP